MDKGVHPNEITFMKKEFARLEKTMSEGFADIKAELKILNRSYVSKEELDKKYEHICKKIESKADLWVQKVMTGFITFVLFSFLAGVTALVFIS